MQFPQLVVAQQFDGFLTFSALLPFKTLYIPLIYSLTLVFKFLLDQMASKNGASKSVEFCLPAELPDCCGFSVKADAVF